MQYTDQLNNNIILEKVPQRIISVVPSQTELLYDLGLENNIVGITKFCVHPASALAEKTKVGGTKKLDIEKIVELKPDLIIANKEENTKEQIEALQKLFPVWVSDINTLDDAYAMIKAIAEITDKAEVGATLLKRIRFEFDSFNKEIKPFKNKSIAYFIWRKPYLLSGSRTFIGNMLSLCGFLNIVGERYPEVEEAFLKSSKPDYIFLSSEPFPFKEKHIAEFKSICPNAKIKLVDGEMFSWYGSRLQYAPKYFRQILLPSCL